MTLIAVEINELSTEKALTKLVPLTKLISSGSDDVQVSLERNDDAHRCYDKKNSIIRNKSGGCRDYCPSYARIFASLDTSHLT